MKIQCKTCNVDVTMPLMEVEDKAQLSAADQCNFVPKGFYFKNLEQVFEDFFYSGGEDDLPELNIAVHQDDVINVTLLGGNGCCGVDGIGGMNVECINGHLVATEKSDCWMPHAIVFNKKK